MFFSYCSLFLIPLFFLFFPLLLSLLSPLLPFFLLLQNVQFQKQDYSLMKELRGHNGPVLTAGEQPSRSILVLFFFSPFSHHFFFAEYINDSNYLCTSATDCNMILWYITSPFSLSLMHTLLSSLSCSLFLSHLLIYRDCGANYRKKTVLIAAYPQLSLCWSHHASVLFSGDTKGTIHAWNIHSGGSMGPGAAPGGPYSSLAESFFLLAGSSSKFQIIVATITIIIVIIIIAIIIITITIFDYYYYYYHLLFDCMIVGGNVSFACFFKCNRLTHFFLLRLDTPSPDAVLMHHQQQQVCYLLSVFMLVSLLPSFQFLVTRNFSFLFPFFFFGFIFFFFSSSTPVSQCAIFFSVQQNVHQITKEKYSLKGHTDMTMDLIMVCR